MEKYFEKGNFEMQTQEFSGSASAPAYSGTVKSWYGLMELSLSASQETTNIAADDIADYLSLTPPMVLTGTIKITGMKIADYQYLFNVVKDVNNMYLFGSQKLAKQVGLSFKNTGVDDEGNMVTNKFILFRCQIDLPPITTASIDEDGNTIRDFTMNIRAGYIKYTVPNGQANAGAIDFATYGVVDSNNSNWDNIKDSFVLPYDSNLPYVVSVTKDAHVATVTITRNGSAFNPANQKVYAGDVLVITATFASGYEVDAATINTSAYTLGQSYTVGSANVAVAISSKAIL